jgi:rhodanese-related sulfurtransferase
MHPEITAAELGEKLKSNEPFVLLDVREPVELGYAAIADPRLENVPMSVLARQGLNALPKSVRAGQIPVYVLCHHGSRSSQVVMWLVQNGYNNAVNVKGGIDDYARKVDSSVGLY